MKAPTLRERFRETTSLAILAAAETIAARDGLANASLQGIADEAGVAVGTIYNYFQDRKVLFEELFARRREELYGAVDAAAKAHARARFEEQLRAFLLAVFEFFDQRRTFLYLALEAEGYKPTIVKGQDGKRRPAMQQLQERAERVIEVGVREKRVRAAAAGLASVLLVAFVRSILFSHFDESIPFASQVDSIVELFLGGVGR
ncbi:MAG TPA: TetR/AcrR family transcriptional regulator [Polyangiaceae bacterium]|jgi:AcrR family transcriptional regulator